MSICARHGTHTPRALTPGEYRMPSLAASDGGQGRTALLDNGRGCQVHLLSMSEITLGFATQNTNPLQ